MIKASELPPGTRLIERGGKMFLDESRKWAKSTEELPRHHIVRYKFAASKCFGRTLDAACGVGYGSSVLARTVPVVGVDIDSSAIEWARKHFPGPEYICGDLTKSPWSGRFSTIVSLETIEHIKEPEQALSAFRKACAGRFIASVPNQEAYPFVAENFANDEFPHFRHYTPDEFQGLLEGCGFQVMAKASQTSKQDTGVVDGTSGQFLIYLCE